jgi:hypothetical protein
MLMLVFSSVAVVCVMGVAVVSSDESRWQEYFDVLHAAQHRERAAAVGHDGLADNALVQHVRLGWLARGASLQ